MNWDDTRRWQVTFEDDTVTEVVLAGDGQSLFAVTDAWRIIRVDLRSRIVVEVVPPTRQPAVSQFAGGPGHDESDGIVPGSVYGLEQAGLPQTSELRIAGVSQVVLSSDGQWLDFQAAFDDPEETGAGWAELVLAEQTDSPVISSAIWPRPIKPVSYSPNWYYTSNQLRTIAALHEDFSGAISDQSPARPSEIVHLYGFGFGTVAPTVAPGAATPVTPLSTVVENTVCIAGDATDARLEVLYGGLAPGWIGLYQFDIRLPKELETGDLSISCGRPEDLPLGDRAGGTISVVSR